MFRTILWYMAGWSYLVVTSPALLWVKYLEKRGKIREKDDFIKRFTIVLAKVLFYLTGSSLSIKGAENIPNGPALFVSNHQSHADSTIIHGFINCPKGFIADKDAENIPILGVWMKHMKCIFIDRENVRMNIRSMADGINILKDGYSIVIYPEGKINVEKQLIEFRKGCLKLAFKAGVPIVPVTLVDTFRIMNRQGRKIRSAHVQCIISEPVLVSSEDRNEDVYIKKVREIIGGNLLRRL